MEAQIAQEKLTLRSSAYAYDQDSGYSFLVHFPGWEGTEDDDGIAVFGRTGGVQFEKG